MPIRESGVATGCAWGLAVWAAGFAANIGWAGDKITSTQWQYLMSVPGGKWFWAGMFGVGALILVIGLITRRYTLRAAGLLIAALGCLLISGYYIVAPLLERGLITLGWWPWLGFGFVYLFSAVVNWRPILWF
jgi:hypothetical protein